MTIFRKINGRLLFGLVCSVLMNSSAGQITNDVTITPLMTFSLRKHFGSAASEFKADELMDYALTVQGTNYFFCRLMSSDERFDFHLFDSESREVKKTDTGMANSHAPDVPISDSYSSNRFKPHLYYLEDAHAWFRPNDLFSIKKPGIYELEVRYRVLVPMTNGVPDLATVTNGQNFAASRVFGVITSNPIRVKVNLEPTRQPK